MFPLLLIIPLQSASAPFDLWTIPSEQRINWINRKLQPDIKPNAAAEVDRAVAAYRSPFDLRSPGMSESERDALRWVNDNQYCLSLRADWPPEFDAAVDRWLAVNRDALSVLASACRTERCVWPISAENGRISSSNSAIGRLTKLRRLFRLAGVKANASARSGDWDGAYEWCWRSHRLAAFARGVPDGLAQMNGDALASAACEQLLVFLRRDSSKWPLDAAARARSEADRRCSRAILDDCYRLYEIDYLERHYAWAADPERDAALREEIAALFEFPELMRESGDAALFHLVPLPFATVEAYRSALAAAPQAGYRPVCEHRCELWGRWTALPLPDAIRELADFEKRLADVSAGHPFGALLNSMHVTPLQNRRVAAARLETRLAALDCVLAVRAFHATAGRYPQSLETLVPKYLPLVPLDPFSTGPLIYRPSPDGFVLYSVGPNLTDDGGRPVVDAEKTPDDILWPPDLPRFKSLAEP